MQSFRAFILLTILVSTTIFAGDFESDIEKATTPDALQKVFEDHWKPDSELRFSIRQLRFAQTLLDRYRTLALAETDADDFERYKIEGEAVRIQLIKNMREGTFKNDPGTIQKFETKYPKDYSTKPMEDTGFVDETKVARQRAIEYSEYIRFKRETQIQNEPGAINELIDQIMAEKDPHDLEKIFNERWPYVSSDKTNAITVGNIILTRFGQLTNLEDPIKQGNALENGYRVLHIVRDSVREHFPSEWTFNDSKFAHKFPYSYMLSSVKDPSFQAKWKWLETFLKRRGVRGGMGILIWGHVAAGLKKQERKDPGQWFETLALRGIDKTAIDADTAKYLYSVMGAPSEPNELINVLAKRQRETSDAYTRAAEKLASVKKWAVRKEVVKAMAGAAVLGTAMYLLPQAKGLLQGAGTIAAAALGGYGTTLFGFRALDTFFDARDAVLSQASQRNVQTFKPHIDRKERLNEEVSIAKEALEAGEEAFGCDGHATRLTGQQ